MPPSKHQKNYSLKYVQLACKAIKEVGLSIQVASDKFRVPKSTLGQGEHRPWKPDWMEHNQLLAVWGFLSGPVPSCDSIFGQEGNQEKFKDNLPTYQWVTKFLGTTPVTACGRKTLSRKPGPCLQGGCTLYRSFSHFTKSVEGTPPKILSTYIRQEQFQ